MCVMTISKNKMVNGTIREHTYRINMDTVCYIDEDEEMNITIHFKNGNKLTFDFDSIRNASVKSENISESMDGLIRDYESIYNESKNES